MAYLIKPVVLFFMIVLLMIPLSTIDGLVKERAHYREIAVEGIASSWTGKQTLEGPWLVVDYHVDKEVRIWDEKRKEYLQDEIALHKRMLVRPTKNVVSTNMDVGFRNRGIYDVPVYKARVAVTTTFDADLINARFDEEGDYSIDKISIELVVSDARGFTGSPKLLWNDQVVQGEPGVSRGDGLEGFSVRLDTHVFDDNRRLHQFKAEFDLRGIEQLDVKPSGFDNQVSMVSNWSHPSFTGDFLPDARKINSNGFEAHWNLSSYASGVSLRPEIVTTDNSFLLPNGLHIFGVRLFQPVDIYTLSDRATKYGLLFVILTFSIFYLIEVIKHNALHPVQYSLVGLALTMFFLLLLSLAEHIGFGYAYLIASLACISTISLYTRAIISQTNAWIMLTLLSILYSACYIILLLEDHALLVGSLLLFGVLVSVMFVTRKIDWSTLVKKSKEVKATRP